MFRGVFIGRGVLFVEVILLVEMFLFVTFCGLNYLRNRVRVHFLSCGWFFCFFLFFNSKLLSCGSWDLSGDLCSFLFFFLFISSLFFCLRFSLASFFFLAYFLFSSFMRFCIFFLLSRAIHLVSWIFKGCVKSKSVKLVKFNLIFIFIS